MMQICPRCSRPNPADAEFCYFDGAPFSNGSLQSGAIDIGKQRFAMPFVFPSGAPCTNFDELARACWEYWDEAQDVLHKGYLEAFFAGLNRSDLATAARQAAGAADGQRGLDQLLGKLPSRALQPPLLAVPNSDLALGKLQMGEDRTFELRLINKGTRLLHGRITCPDCVWLGIGEGTAVRDKLFAFTRELVIPLQVRGKQLRAGPRSLVAQIEIESNGGDATVAVRADVPPRPFPGGVMAGALTPRQLAEKARAKPKEAALCFERGEVAQWYRDNGWDYPVQVEGSTGLAVIQQFFEALGLAAPPRVSISRTSLAFQGQSGEHLQQTLELTTPEKRAVWAHAVSDRPWLQVSKEAEGKAASIRVEVRCVPDNPDETLHGTVKVTSNGNQRFEVPVTLVVIARTRTNKKSPLADVLSVEPVPPIPVTSVATLPAAAAAPAPAAIPIVAAQIAPASIQAAASVPPNGQRIVDEPLTPMARRPLHWTGSIHLAPAGILLVALLAPIIHDVLLKIPPAPLPEVVEEEPLDWEPKIQVKFQDEEYALYTGTDGIKSGSSRAPDPKDIYIEDPTARFGVVTLREKDPKNGNEYKRLTFKPTGWTNNTVVRIDGEESIFGELPLHNKESGKPLDGTVWPGNGEWKERSLPLGEDSDHHPRQGRKSIWVYPKQHIEITQVVEIVRGDTRLLDTCLVTYRILNDDKQSHRIGLRFMLDTFIGSTDGVPFTVPTLKTPKLCDSSDTFDGKNAVPDFVQVLEREDLANPGTIAQLQFKLGNGLESPDRVTLGAWPNPKLQSLDQSHVFNQQWTLWDVPVLSMKAIQQVAPAEPADSCVVMYWEDKTLQPGKSRDVGFTYGLGSVAGGEGGGKLALTVGGSFSIGGEFTVTAYVSRPQRDQTVTLVLPDGFELLAGSMKQNVPPLPRDATRNNSPVTWRVRAPLRKGNYSLKVESSTGVSQTRSLTIEGRRLFD